MTAKQLLRRLRKYPPYLGAGVRVTEIADDFKIIRVEMPLRFYNRNCVGTHFGGWWPTWLPYAGGCSSHSPANLPEERKRQAAGFLRRESARMPIAKQAGARESAIHPPACLLHSFSPRTAPSTVSVRPSL